MGIRSTLILHLNGGYFDHLNYTFMASSLIESSKNTMSKVPLKVDTYEKGIHASSSMLATGEAVKGTTQHPVMSHQAQAFSVVFSHHYDSGKNYVITKIQLRYVSDILTGIDKGVPLGYHRPRCQRISRNILHPQKSLTMSSIYNEVTTETYLTIPPYQTYSAPELELCPRKR